MAIALLLTEPLIPEEKAAQERLYFPARMMGMHRSHIMSWGDESKSCDNMKEHIFVAWYQSKDHRTRKLKNK